MAHSPRGWTGARTPSAIKRVRQAERRRAINQPRRTAAKTLVVKALVSATDLSHSNGTPEEVQAAVQRAVSALDRAAKIGAIHKNAADRRKSRLMLKINAAVGGEKLAAPAKSARQVGKAQAAKEAKARIAASRAVKAKGAQTAAGKARAALARTSRTEGADTTQATAATESAPAKTTSRSTKAAPKSTTAKASSAKTSSAKTTAKASSAKATASKSSAESKPRAAKSTTKKS